MRSAIVTGGSSGIGRAISVKLAGDGFDVIVADIRRDPIAGGDPTDQVIAAAGGRALYVEADVSSAEANQLLIETAVGRTGSLDVVVNNAVLAAHQSKPLLTTTKDNWDQMMAVNLRGPFLMCQAAVRQMLTQPLIDEVRGRIINITSQHGMVASPGHFTYAVGKGGLVQMTRADRGGARQGRHHLQRGGAGEDRDRHRGRPERVGGGPCLRHLAHALPAPRPGRGRGRGCSLPGIGSVLRERNQSDGGRRLDGVLTPSAGGSPWLNLSRYLRDPLPTLERWSAHGPVVLVPFPGGHDFYLVTDGPLIRKMLVDDGAVFVKGRALQAAKRLLGDGLLTSEGAEHLAPRRMIQPVFHRR